MELCHPEHTRIEIVMLSQKRFQLRRGDAARARDGEVRFPGAFVDGQTADEGGFVDTLVQLKQMRVRLSHAGPKNMRLAAARDPPTPATGRKKGRKEIAASFSFSTSRVVSSTCAKKASVR